MLKNVTIWKVEENLKPIDETSIGCKLKKILQVAADFRHATWHVCFHHIYGPATPFKDRELDRNCQRHVTASLMYHVSVFSFLEREDVDICLVCILHRLDNQSLSGKGSAPLRCLWELGRKEPCEELPNLYSESVHCSAEAQLAALALIQSLILDWQRRLVVAQGKWSPFCPRAWNDREERKFPLRPKPIIVNH